MTRIQSIETWNVLKEMGFQSDRRVYSDIQPGLSYEFGNLTLSAGAVTTGWQLRPMISFTGIMKGNNCFADVEFAMPRTIETIEMCAAWITWHLDQSSDGNFRPARNTDWLVVGRSNKLLLPWVIDTDAYDRRPACSVEREWARMMIKRLRSTLANAADSDDVSFEFDGTLLKIRCGDCLIPGSAQGIAWKALYILKACQLRELPTRLKHSDVWFSIWDGKLSVANWSYGGVIADKMQ